MSKTVALEQLNSAITDTLTIYSADVAEKIKEAVDDVAKDTLEMIQSKAPTGNRGRYKRGWKTKVAHDSTMEKRVVVHNKTDYQLTHLLEFGHAKVNGGRTRAIAHIRPAEEKAIKEFEKRVEEAVKG